MELSDPVGGGSTHTPGPQTRVLHGRYRIEKTLGQGGMGEVVLAVDELLHRRVALKRMLAQGDDREARRRAMLKEARRASQINDPHIASLYDVLDAGDEITLVMEFVDGETLRQRMVDPVSLTEFWSIAIQCAEGLAAAHAQGVIHRDIKPENLMLTPEGQVKILDFGVARRTASGVDTTTSLTDKRAQDVAGTPHYMAPEAHLGNRPDERTDIFSLGVVFYELLTRRRPFEGSTYGAVLDKILNTTPPPILYENPDAGSELSQTVARMLSRDPAQRFQSTAELLQQLAQSRGIGVAAITAPPVRRPRVTWAVWGGIAAILAAVAVAGVLWRASLTAALPPDLNLAVLPPATPGADGDFTRLALGSIELLSARLQHRVDRAGFQLASFTETYDEKVHSAADARKVLGANVALLSTLERSPDVLRARLELRETTRERMIASRIVETPVTQPFRFLDRIHDATVDMLRLQHRSGDTTTETGIHGAGTMRFYLQGLASLHADGTEADARRAVGDMELATRTEPEAGTARAGLALAQLRVWTVARDSAALASAEVAARQAVALGPSSPQTHYALGMAFEARKRPQESLMEFARAVDLDPTDDVARFRLARTYARLGQPDKERATFLETIRQRPHCWRPYWWLATSNYREGRIEEAKHAFEDMIRRSPQLYTGYSGLGGLLILDGDYARAIETLKHSVELRPTQQAFQNLGTAYFNSGRFTESVDAYNQSFQFGRGDYVTWLNLGDAYFWLRDRKDEAKGAYNQAVRLGREEIASRANKGRPVDARIFSAVATVFPKLDQPDSARAYLDTALHADSTNTLVQCDAAVALWQLGERDRAMTWLTKAVQGGYPTVWLRDSPMFNDWRDVPEFRTLASAANQEPATR